MVPAHIVDYLRQNGVPFTQIHHDKAVTAQELAADIHISGYRVAKSVIVEAGGEKWLTVLPATERVDLKKLAEELRVPSVQLLRENQFKEMFPGCEVGAEPPFGRLYGIPVLVDVCLAEQEEIVLRAGTHDDVIRMKYADFEKLEKPGLINFGRPAVAPEPELPRPSERKRSGPQ